MDIGLVGVGRMGEGIALRAARAGHHVLVHDVDPTRAARFQEEEGIKVAPNLASLGEALPPPRVVWVMVPDGEPTGRVIDELAAVLDENDIIIDGGNSFYRDTMRRHAGLRIRGIHLVDVGTSGGIWGIENGFSLMIGGDHAAISRLRPLFESLAPGRDRGWGHVGPPGAGHFAKMVHNGVEYGLMQAYAEGFELLRMKREFGLDLHQVAEIWRHGSVVRSWLLDLAADVLLENPALEGIKGCVGDSGEGRWTVKECIDAGVPAPVITMALMSRFASRQDDRYAAKLLAALRRAFGGHAVEPQAEGGDAN